jgi:hypothetical protein
MLQFSESIGPLVKIVSKMFDDFINFLILYFLLAIMFTTIANLNFIYTLAEFQGLFESFLTITDASLGNFNFEMFEAVNDEGLRLFGQFLILISVICFNLLLLNLIVAILANTYNMFDLRATGLYLSKILNTRGELLYEENYGGFLAATPPINVIQLPFILPAIFLRKGTPLLIKINNFVMLASYCTFMMICFGLFMTVSIAFIPFAWLIGIYDKTVKTSNQNMSQIDKLINFLFIPFGPVILFADLMADFFYFWKNNFRNDLK